MSSSYDSKSYDSLRFRNETKFAKKALELEKHMNNKLKTLITSKEKWDAFGDCLDNVYSKKMRSKKND
jgi:hypothetical protein